MPGAFSRDLPIWIAAGQIDSVQLANRHLLRGGVVANEAGGWPRDTSSYPNPQGNGRWSQEIYYSLLNCGLRIPATAGSGAGANSNPVGYNRVYVHLDPEIATEKSDSGKSDQSRNHLGQLVGSAARRAGDGHQRPADSSERERRIARARVQGGRRSGGGIARGTDAFNPRKNSLPGSGEKRPQRIRSEPGRFQIVRRKVAAAEVRAKAVGFWCGP